MNIIAIHEYNHGFIGVAIDVPSAIDFLFAHGWLDKNTEVYDGREQKWVSIIEYFGDNWQNIIRGMSAYDFNDAFLEVFELEPLWVYEKDN